MRRLARATLVVMGALWAAACPASDEDEARDVGGDATATQSETLDVGVTSSPDASSSENDAEAVGGDDTTALPDVLQDTGEPAGSGCDSGSECASGWCVPSAIGQVCVDPCVTDCPDGHVCVQADGAGSDPVFLCVPLVRPDPGDDTVGGDTVGREDATPPDATVDNDVLGPDAPLGDAPADDTTTGEDATVDPDVILDPDAGDDPDGVVSDGDQDDDGIPDDEDNIPCMGFFLTVYNEGVTAGSMALNGAEVVSPASFPTDDPIIVPLNPVQGTNTLAITGKLTGSPSDSLTLVVQDTTGRLWFYVVIVRQPGAPTEHSYTFEIDVDCEALER